MTHLQVEDLVEQMVAVLRELPINGAPTNEKEFEQEFVEKQCLKILDNKTINWERAVHPWGDEAKEKAWRDSKEWGAVSAWGMTHAFDLVARDKTSKTSIGVEVKFAKIRGRRAPNGAFQQMVGQCLLGRLRHKAMIGVLGYVGEISRPFQGTTEEYRRKLQKEHGIWVVVRRVDD
jgi:hypothetical protein